MGMLQLPPLSHEEAIQPEPDLTADEFMFRGGYPHLYDASTPNDIYFHDNGLLNYLLGIHSAEELLNDPKRGDVFENLIISQTVKRYLNKNKDGELYFYRDTNQSEIDLVDATQRRSPTHHRDQIENDSATRFLQASRHRRGRTGRAGRSQNRRVSRNRKLHG